MRARPIHIATVLLIFVGIPFPAAAQRISLIRDAEIERTIRAFAAPLFTVAGLDASAVRIHMVNDRALNAFVAGGMNLFLNAGLLMASDSANQIIGVIAHETGHIAGGHLARGQDALRNAGAETILAYVLGGVAAAAGRADAAAAIIAGGAQVAQRGLLKYSRVQEQAADQAAVSLLRQTGQSSRGLLNFMEQLGDQDLLNSGAQDPYVRSHPLSRDRIRFLAEQTRRSPFAATPDSREFARLHGRMVAKLVGFLAPAEVARRYPRRDDGLAARYARAIAAYRLGEIDRALAGLDDLLTDNPDDPFFHELRGQILFENGRLRAALPSYGRAVALMPDAAPLRLGLARAQLETNDPALVKAAVAHLRKAVRLEPRNHGAWRQLGIAYGRDGQLGLSSLALAEEALLRGRKAEAKNRAKRATRRLKENSAAWLRAQDILNEAERKPRR